MGLHVDMTAYVFWPAMATGSTATYWYAEYGTWSLATVRPWWFS